MRHKKIRSDDYTTTDDNCALKSIGDRTGEAGVVEATASHKSGVKVGGTGDQKLNHSLSSMWNILEREHIWERDGFYPFCYSMFWKYIQILD